MRLAWAACVRHNIRSRQRYIPAQLPEHTGVGQPAGSFKGVSFKGCGLLQLLSPETENKQRACDDADCGCVAEPGAQRGRPAPRGSSAM